MSKPYHWGRTLTAIGLVAALAGCSGAMSGTKSASAQDANFDASKVGLATKAQAAMAAGNLDTAVSLAESAVEYRPQDPTFRTLLGNIYLASGRFASAEATYRDSLSLNGAQPQVVLRLALAQIALGKAEQASGLLASAQSMLDPADLGLALALAGRPDQAIMVLEPAARALGADSRIRQNLALAHALGGDWDSSRAIAAQDIPADQLAARLDQWMALAKPGQAGAQIATFIGVTPAALDPGQPVRLALNPAQAPTRLAAAEQVAAPVAMPLPAPQAVAEAAVPYAAPVEYSAPVVEAAAPYLAPAPVEVAASQRLETPVAVASPVEATVQAAAAPRKSAGLRAPRPALTPAAVRLAQSLPDIRRAAMPKIGRSQAVVQLGAYDSRSHIAGAWTRLAAKYSALGDYKPVTARFDSADRTFYRLSVKGFASDREAIQLCASLKRAGGSCFVRAISGDAPIQMASR
ncbi:MAG: tetratricopeptide repeat protein [Pseudomonadota bacterium]|nr:tetratricopeptide repeat protein [Pseudomonadota bacterium]